MTAKAKTDARIDLPEFQIAQWWNAMSTWLLAHWLQIAIAVVVGIVIYVVLGALRSLGKRNRLGADAPIGPRIIIARVAAKTNHFFMMMASAKLVAGYARPPQMVATTITFLFTLAAVFQVAIWLREIILSLVERKTQDEEHGAAVASAMGIIRLLVSTALFAIAAIVVLDNLGVNVTGLVAGLGVGGIAIGLAAQGIFSDLFAALAIIFDKPFRRGEHIQYDQTKGIVQRIGLKTTRLRSDTGEKRIISNADLLKKEIINNAQQAYKRIKFVLGVIYQTDIDDAEKIPAMLKEIVEASGGKFVRAAFVNFGASSLDYELEFDIVRPAGTAIDDVRQKVGLGILRRFNAAGIEFAYPTQTAFTAAPDGRMILPYPQQDGVEDVPVEKPAAKVRARSGPARS